MYTDATGQDRVYVSVEAVSADVCGDGNFDRQRTQKEVQDLGAVDGEAVQKAVPGKADAGAAVASMGARVCVSATASSSISEQRAAG